MDHLKFVQGQFSGIGKWESLLMSPSSTQALFLIPYPSTKLPADLNQTFKVAPKDE